MLKLNKFWFEWEFLAIYSSFECVFEIGIYGYVL